MTTPAVIVALAVLGALALVQLLVALGLPYGRFVWGGQHVVLPARLRVGSTVAILAYAGFGALLLSRAGVLPGGTSGFATVATWVLFAFFVASVLGNAVSRSSAERWAMAPASAVLAAATLVIALG